jgi:hypothetical protein
LSKRAGTALDQVREDFAWLEDSSRSYLVQGPKATTWWTFSGLRANTGLASLLRHHVGSASAGNLAVSFSDRVDPDWLQSLLRSPEVKDAVPDIDERKLRHLKFADCLPRNLSTWMLQARATDRQAVEQLASMPVRGVALAV